jgi:hypothetical protein
MFGAPERLRVFGAPTFSTVIAANVVQDLNGKIACVECIMFRLSIACACIVTEPLWNLIFKTIEIFQGGELMQTPLCSYRSVLRLPFCGLKSWLNV